jgi:hypothetical protein
MARSQSGYRESNPELHLGKVMRCHYATSAWSLRPVLTRGPLPYRGSTLPLSYGGMKLAGLDSNQRRTMIQSHVAPADRATGHQSRHWVLPPANRPYRGRPVVGPSGEVCPRGFEPPRPLRTTRPSTAGVYHSNHEHIEPLSGVEPDRLPYEGRIAAARNGKAGDPGLEPRPAGPEPAVLPDYTSLHWLRRRGGSRTHNRAVFGTGRSASWSYSPGLIQ